MELLLALFIGLLLLLFFNYLSSQRDILSPSVVMAAMFIVSTIFALINAKNWNIDYELLSTFYILSGIIVFSIPVTIVSNKVEAIPEIVSYRKLSISTWKIIFAILVDLVIIYLYRKEMYQLAAQAGYSGQSIQWFIRNSTSYEGSIELSAKIRLLVRFVDITAYIFIFTFLNNFIYDIRRKSNLLLLVPVFLFIYKTSLTGGRQDILKLLVAAVVQTYILQKAKVGWRKVISSRYLMIGLTGLLFGIPSFYYGLFLVGRTTTRSMMESVSTYIGGPIQHFNQFVQNPTSPSRYIGSESLTPILNILGDLGLIDYNETVHLEFRQLGVTIGNVYTFFRRPLHDFGPVGMYLFVFLVGVLFAYLYYVVIRSKRRSDLWDMNVMVYSYLFYWIFLSSIEQYSMTIISVFTLIAIILFYLLSIFYWQFTFTPRGIAFVRRDNEIQREEF
ncbi:O-antigen ligase [Streptococcus suis]|uniref:O-antigen polymerase n=1 Tax=Streptococcus suis TaxID=1307 RepID=UPI00240E5F82|nr:O-antigen polymerase [Streptococcus suis]WFA75761.1 O-antigen ligase [Streptococcus suis]